MTGIEWLLWAATVWAAWLAFVVTDVPALVARAADRLRQQHTPHWARHGHTPPDDHPAPQHHRHTRRAR
ncbi:hypothetical protein ACLVWQ_17735 (plasmid) [Streptomyces sp. CWNU-52B]|uniref:hypothetical protein n=1 Tax=unclassified Streptomyces TaxID=2593676 RepID=UPI0039C27EC7